MGELIESEQEHIEDRAAHLRPAQLSNILLWVIVGIMVVFIAWAALTELDASVRGPGRVVPSSQLQVVSNLEGGIIEEIFVTAGETVVKGAPLMALDQTETGANLGSSQASVDALRAKIARLEAEVAGQEPNFPGGGAGLREQVEIERALYASRMADLASLLSAATARVQQAERGVAEAQATLEARQAAAQSADEELRIIRPLVERGIEPRLSLTQSESRAAVARSEVAAASAGLTRAQAAVVEARASLNQQRQDWRSRAAGELAAAQGDLASRRQALPALESRVDRTTVRAPMSGLINRVLKTTVGGSIAPGEPLVEMVPSDDSLLIEARIRPQDIGFVAIGQQAEVDISAYDPTVYGGLRGEVVTISPDSTVDERSGESYYLVQVRTGETAIVNKFGERMPIGPGMTATVSLLGEKRTILSYIFRPITRLSQRAFRE